MNAAPTVFETKALNDHPFIYSAFHTEDRLKKRSKLKRKRKSEIIYPESDGKPMADNTVQYKKIVMIKENLERLFAHDDHVFIAADLFWYTVKGNIHKKLAPDVMVAFGRPKGDRRSYLQWKEGNIPPQIVFEILSHNNTTSEMKEKFNFYEQYGVEEYYVYDPDKVKLEGWIRSRNQLEKIVNMNGWVSPRLQIRFDISQDDLEIYYPDGQKFLSFIELDEERTKEKIRADIEKVRADTAEEMLGYEKQRAEQESQRAEKEKHRAEKESQRAEKEKHRAEKESQRAEKEKHRAEKAEAEMAILMAKLKALNVDR
ncbi:MAG: Uma2 family endonuclease [Candidatus Magnetomorum sp.]|nr:Uma2 family endonuclease [Candidatus Magnetomorum sp.]